MKCSVIFTSEVTQINLIPESPLEEAACKSMEGKAISVRRGCDLKMNLAGYLRNFDDFFNGKTVAIVFENEPTQPEERVSE